MQAQAPRGARVSRETRLLFATIVIAVVALWVLARLRFPEQPPSVNPVTPVLTQLAPTPAFTDLAGVVSDVQSRALTAFTTVRLRPVVSRTVAARTPLAIAALRIRDDVAVALLDPARTSWHEWQLEGASLLNLDPATGLATLKVPALPTPALTEWSPSRLASPRYLLSTATVADTISLRPVFVSALRTENSPMWDTSLWLLPAHTEMVPGVFTLTTTGAFAGLVVPYRDGAAILPAGGVSDAADRVLKQRQGPRGWLGLEVQPLTPALSEATGAPQGVIVTWVDPKGPAGGSIQIGDVLDQMDDGTDVTVDLFQARTARMLAGDDITVHVRRGVLAQPVRLTAIEPSVPPAVLGLVMRRVSEGVEVVRVQPRSAAERAGIQSGDVITYVGGTPSPSALQVTRAFNALKTGALVVAVTRGDRHFVVAIEKP